MGPTSKGREEKGGERKGKGREKGEKGEPQPHFLVTPLKEGIEG